MKCFRWRCYVNNSFLVFHQGTKHSKTIKHSRFALVFHTVFSCLDPLMKHSNSLFTYNMNIIIILYQILRPTSTRATILDKTICDTPLKHSLICSFFYQLDPNNLLICPPPPPKTMFGVLSVFYECNQH